jgi:hypothetical protein
MGSVAVLKVSHDEDIHPDGHEPYIATHPELVELIRDRTEVYLQDLRLSD